MEEFEERAAILEYEAGMPRKEAERFARKLILKKKAEKVLTNDSRMVSFTYQDTDPALTGD